MMTGTDPAVQRRHLVTELRGAREAAGQTQAQVAEAMDWSPSKVIRIEKGEVKVTRNDLRALLDHYGITDPATVEDLLAAAQAAGREGTWADYADSHDPGFLEYLEFESLALRLRNYQSDFVPGLLQVEEYYQAIQETLSPEQMHLADRRWEVRERRQRVHEYPSPPQMEFMLDESILWREVGARATHGRQLRHLREMSDSPHITLRVLPFTAGPYPAMGTPFIHLEFKELDEADVIYLEREGLNTDITSRTNTKLASTYLGRFFAMEKLALTVEDTNDLLDRAIDGLSTSIPASY